MTAPEQPNVELLHRIPLDARLVLDIGCGTGALGAEYKRRNPLANYVGVEADAEAARLAAQRLDAVFVANLDSDPLPFSAQVGPGSVDCLIYGEGLPDLIDPWAVLRAHAALLSDRGIVVASLPNQEYWEFAERLLRGTWDYDAHGLLDRRHLRWFSRESARRLLLGAGLLPLDVTPHIPDADAAAAFTEAMAPALRQLGIDVPHFRERTAPAAHVWRAGRGPTPRLSVVSTMLKPIGGVSELRVTQPMHALGAEPTLHTRIIPPGHPEAGSGDPPGIFIFHRPLLAGELGRHRLRGLLDEGWLLVCEFDDHPDYIPVLQRPDVLNFRGVHAVQTTTEPLADILRRENPEVRVFPNAIERLPDIANHRTPGRVTMLFAGLNRDNEWPPYLDALNAAVGKAGERLHTIVVQDRPLFDQLATPHKTFLPICAYDTYQSMLASCEISFMPLQDTPFNRCKSDLKFIEAAAHRVTSLASSIVYDGTIEDGVTGVLFHSAEDLEQRLLRLVANPEITRTIGDAARAYVARERMLAYQVAERRAWYHDLWARRAELHAALLARMPEFADAVPALP